MINMEVMDTNSKIHKNPQISVVILCYRAEEFAPIFIRQVEEVLKKNELDYELILVANYQSHAEKIDKTPAIVSEFAKGRPQLVVVSKEKQGMMGWDMRSGLDAATGDTVAIIDGDGQMPAEDLIKVYSLLKIGNFALAKTYRNHRFDGFVRVLISRVYNILLKLFFPRVKVLDANSKPKIFTRATLDKLNLTSDDWFIDAEIIIKASQLGFSIGEVSTSFYPNENRPSFVRFTAIFEFIKNLFRYRFKTLFKK